MARKQILKASPVKLYAVDNNIPIFQPEKIKTDYQIVLDAQPDVIIVAAFGQMIPKILLDYPQYRCINVHASLLPKYRGGSPMHTAIKNGDLKTGVTIMLMAPKMDAGAILSQSELLIDDSDNVGTIESKLASLGRDLLLDTLIKLMNNEIFPQEQDESKVTFAYTIKPSEERLDFCQTAKQIYNHVRAFYPWPIAHIYVDGQIIKIHQVTMTEKMRDIDASVECGTVVGIMKGEVYIKVKDGIIILKIVQPEGRQAMDIKSFMNGSGNNVFCVGKLLK